MKDEFGYSSLHFNFSRSIKYYKIAIVSSLFFFFLLIFYMFLFRLNIEKIAKRESYKLFKVEIEMDIN